MLDDKTEMIAHFIGIFELKTEEARMKVQYQEFAAQIAENPDLGQLFNITIHMTSGYGLGGFMPDMKWPLSFVSVPVSDFSVLIPGAFGFVPFGLPTFFDDIFDNFPGAPSASKTVFSIPLPSQMATVTVQANYLEDFDVLNTYEGNAEFINAAAYNSGLEYLEDIARDLQPLRTPDPAANEDAIAQAGLDLSEDIKALEESGVESNVEGAEIYAAFNGDINEFTVNGESAEEMPELAEHSHRFAKSEEEDEEEETNEAKSVSGEVLTDEDAEENSHEASTGGNLLLNESYIATNWLDAPVFTVMGKVVSADVISQVNVYSDVDMLNGALHHDENGTNTYNAAHFEQISTAIENTDEDAEEGEATPPGNGPENTVVVTLEGNLLNYNYVKQFNFANDGDIMSVGFSANETMIQMGNNSLVNATSILGLGFYYDLIIVDGDIIDLAYLSQTNVLLDSDKVNYKGDFAGKMSTSDNVLFNWGKIKHLGIDHHKEMNEAYGEVASSFMAGKGKLGSISKDSVFADTDLLKVLHIKGSILDVQIIEQFNVLGDGDQVEMAQQTLASAEGADVSLITGQNELLNLASITDAGMDSTIYTNEGAYTDAFLYQADFVSEEDPLVLAASDTLAGEAFLFLADGILEGEAPEDGGVNAPAPSETAVDVMQTVLA